MPNGGDNRSFLSTYPVTELMEKPVFKANKKSPPHRKAGRASKVIPMII
jgi:hypothetical protein